MNLRVLENNENEQKDVIEDKLILIDIQNKLEAKKNQIETDEKYKEAEETLNRLKNELTILKVQSTFEMWKRNLIKKINDAFNLSKEEMIKQVNILQNDYDSLIAINEEKMSLFKNNIDWKIPSIKNINDKSQHIKLIDKILEYNNNLEVIKKIEEIKMINDKSKIIKISSNLNQKTEYKSLIKYIISLTNYQNFDFEYANSICRAYLMLNIYKNNISIKDLSNFFIDLDEKKNRIGNYLIKDELDEDQKKFYTEKNKLLKDEFIYIYKITGLYDLNMDIIIPSFKVTDLVHLFFTFENSEKYYLGPAFNNIELIEKENLYECLYINVKEKIKNLNSFKDVAGKIALMFYKYFNKDINEIPEFVNGDKILQYFENKYSDKSSDIFKKIEELMNTIKLGSYFDEYKIYKEELEKRNNKLTFDDFICIKDKFSINSILNINNLPSFQYFLQNNYDNIEILLKTVKKENINKLFQPSPFMYIPFWVFIIRIMSSTNCLIFENNKNPFEKELTEIIRQKILKLMEKKKHTDLSWINLITDDIKSDKIFNKKIHMFYSFFNKICLIETYPKPIYKYIKSLLIGIFESLFDICLNFHFNDLLDADIKSNKYPSLGFVDNPKEFIKKYINSKLSKKIKSNIQKHCSNYTNSLKNFLILIENAQTELKQKVEQLEIKLKIKEENELIEKFQSKYNRDINNEEKEKLLQSYDSQKIYFGHFTIDSVISLLKDSKDLLQKKLLYLNKLINNETIELNEFNHIFNNLKKKLEDFDFIYNVDDYYDEDFINYLNNFQKNVNSFKNNFNIFSKYYDSIERIDTDRIYIKDFSLPTFQNNIFHFDLNDIEDKSHILAQPIIVKQNNKLFCNYKKIYFNPGPISPELFDESFHLKIYSLVDESLNVEIEKKIQNEESTEVAKHDENIGRNIKELYDKKYKQYINLKKSHIDPKSSIYIDFYFPPKNTSEEEVIYRLIRNLKVSNKSSCVNIIIEIIFIVYPIQIDFSCDEYSLTFENNQYKLNATKLLKGETIKFKIKNNYSQIPLILNHTIKSLDKNTYDKPKIEIKNSNEIDLTIQKNDSKIEDIDILNCLIEIFISENMKIPILIDSLIISTYFDFYIYDYETKNFVTDKMYIYIPTFDDECLISLNFLISTFNNLNIIGQFNILEISEGITVIESQKKMKINSNENYFTIKLKFDLTKFSDNDIAAFEFNINFKNRKK